MQENFNSITLTNSASERIISVLNKDKSSKFRVYVTGGGCSGFQYGFKFDDIQAIESMAFAWMGYKRINNQVMKIQLGKDKFNKGLLGSITKAIP